MLINKSIEKTVVKIKLSINLDSEEEIKTFKKLLEAAAYQIRFQYIGNNSQNRNVIDMIDKLKID